MIGHNRVAAAAALAALAWLVTGCPLHRSALAAPGAGPAADSGHHAQRLPDFGSSRKSHGIIDGLFDRSPDEGRSPADRTGGQPTPPFVDLMRHAYGPGRQAYEVPLQEPRSPAVPRPPRQHRR